MTCENKAQESREERIRVRIFLAQKIKSQDKFCADVAATHIPHATRSPSALDLTAGPFVQSACCVMCRQQVPQSVRKQNRSELQWGCALSHLALTSSAQAPACQQNISLAFLHETSFVYVLKVLDSIKTRAFRRGNMAISECGGQGSARVAARNAVRQGCVHLLCGSH